MHLASMASEKALREARLAEGMKTLAMKQLKISSPKNGELPYVREQTD